MLFNSIDFILFFSIFFLVYLKLGYKNQNILLFLAGIVFYSFWNFKMVFLLLFCILFNFYTGINLNKISNGSTRRIFFKLTILVNLFILVVFKYAVFSVRSLNDILNVLSVKKEIPVFEILLPVGISFYTFHNISYIYDVYKKKIQPTFNLITYSVYDLFFPLLLAGPIERTDKLIPQIEQKRVLSWNKFKGGLLLFAWGIFKKVVIADNLAPFVNKSLDPSLDMPNGLVYFVAIAFAFQIYADFSGYTDAARGMAKMIGFELSLNFNIPFMARNPIDFWRRWHISLSTWLRDYVYIPLGGNRYGFFRQNVNLMLVWILGGLWHGATYGYMLWGAYCGFQIVIYNVLNRFLFRKYKDFFESIDSFLKPIGILFTFFLFAYGILLFRVENYFHLLRLIKNLDGFYYEPILFIKLIYFLLPILIVESVQIYHRYTDGLVLQKVNRFAFSFIVVFFFVQFGLSAVFEKYEFFYFQF
ncbi:MAG: MBOAT family protein [Leptospiraceae bacterium]|nr:MBOAT family protein [Leptospiraceae bacterium]